MKCASDLNKFIEDTNNASATANTTTQNNLNSPNIQHNYETSDTLDEMFNNNGIDLKYKNDLIALVKSILPTIPIDSLNSKDVSTIQDCLSTGADDFTCQLLYGTAFADTDNNSYDKIEFDEQKKCVLELMTTIIMTLLKMPKKTVCQTPLKEQQYISRMPDYIPKYSPITQPFDKLKVLSQINDIRNALFELETAIREA